jgi:hypothetical protein
MEGRDALNQRSSTRITRETVMVRLNAGLLSSMPRCTGQCHYIGVGRFIAIDHRHRLSLSQSVKETQAVLVTCISLPPAHGTQRVRSPGTSSPGRSGAGCHPVVPECRSSRPSGPVSELVEPTDLSVIGPALPRNPGCFPQTCGRTPPDQPDGASRPSAEIRPHYVAVLLAMFGFRDAGRTTAAFFSTRPDCLVAVCV